MTNPALPVAARHLFDGLVLTAGSRAGALAAMSEVLDAARAETARAQSKTETEGRADVARNENGPTG